LFEEVAVPRQIKFNAASEVSIIAIVPDGWICS